MVLLAAYSFWAQEERQKLAALHPHLGRKHLTKVLRQRWKLIPQQEKAPYLEQAERDKERADKETMLENAQALTQGGDMGLPLGLAGVHLLDQSLAPPSGLPTVDAIQNVIEASKLQAWNPHELAQFVSLLGQHKGNMPMGMAPGPSMSAMQTLQSLLPEAPMVRPLHSHSFLE